MVAKMTPFINALNTLNGVTARVVWDSAGAISPAPKSSLMKR
jgi:hypothetical protein